MSCGCCECLSGATLAPSTYNRPGLARITRRIGTYGSFLDTMIARLGSLPALTTREADDPAIALLDAWAVVGDVLTFYQERIANEGYLRTATERLSILELARLVGYRLRPGVSASVHVAYTVDAGAKTIIPAGAQVQSSGTSDEQPQTFETYEEIEARSDWNTIEPRMKKPQLVERTTPYVWFAGANLNIKAGDWLIFDFGNEAVPRRAVAVSPDHALDRTRVSFVDFIPRNDYRADNPIEALMVPSSIAPRTPQHLARTLGSAFAEGSSNSIVALTQFHPQLSATIWTALANYAEDEDLPALQGVYVLRARAALFGYNAPPVYAVSVNGDAVQFGRPQDVAPFPETNNVLYLDQVYDGVLPGGFLLAHTTGSAPRALRIREADAQTRSEYGVSTKTTRVETVESFWNAQSNFAVIRSTAIFTQSEKLELTEQPIDEPIGTEPVQKDRFQTTSANQREEDPRAIRIELGAVYEGLDSGRYAIVEGERLDVPGVRSAELSMLARVEQKIGEGAASYTVLHLANPLAWFYKRDTVRIYANVTKATHGATQREILGSGDGTVPLQPFDLRQKPLTYVAAATPNGIASTLNVRVSDLLWHETDSLGSAGPADHVYATAIADDGTVTVTFGTGTRGARLPTGADNVRAVYRYGIGSEGNVGPGRINNALTRPTGVTGVTNPLTASGGAGPESRDSARGNAPLAVQALDRLVSVRDYEDFARTFAGIAKASAARFTRGRRQFVHLTVAGQDDIPILGTSDLYKALSEAVVKYGDVAQPVRLDLREAKLIAGSARVRIHPEYLWESVAAAITAALQLTFAFDARTLGQPVFPSEVIAAIQAVPGVEYVDLDALDGFTVEELTSDDPTLGERLAEAGVNTIPSLLAHYDADGVLHPAQVVYLSPQLPDAFVLTEIPQ